MTPPTIRIEASILHTPCGHIPGGLSFGGGVVVVVVGVVVVGFSVVVVVVVLLVEGAGVVGVVGHPVNAVVFLVGHPVAILTCGGSGVSPLGGSVVVGRVMRAPPAFVGNTSPPGFLVVGTNSVELGGAGAASVELGPGAVSGVEPDGLYPGGRRLAGNSNLIGTTGSAELGGLYPFGSKLDGASNLIGTTGEGGDEPGGL